VDLCLDALAGKKELKQPCGLSVGAVDLYYHLGSSHGYHDPTQLPCAVTDLFMARLYREYHFSHQSLSNSFCSNFFEQ
jgi:hypothetical protein